MLPTSSNQNCVESVCIRWSVTVGSLKSESPKSLALERRASGSIGVSIEILHIYKVK